MMAKGQHFPRDAQAFLVKTVEDAIRSRKENNVVTSDIIQAMIEMERQANDGMKKG